MGCDLFKNAIFAAIFKTNIYLIIKILWEKATKLRKEVK